MNLLPWTSSSIAPSFGSRISQDLSAFQQEMNSLINSFFNRGDLRVPVVTFDTSFYPNIDLLESDNKYSLDADVPGLNESDLDIDFHNHTLSIKGSKKMNKASAKKGESVSDEGDYVCCERSTGEFRRDIYLDQDVDQDSIKAELKDGVLHVEMTKKAPSKAATKKIAIRH